MVMIFLLVFGGLILILALFYLVNSIQQYGEWKGATILVVLSLVATVYGGWGTYQEHRPGGENVASSSQSVKTRGRDGGSQQALDESKLGQTTMAGMDQNRNNQGQKEMVILRQMQKNYSKMGTVDFDEKTKSFNITPTDDSTVKAFKALANDPSVAKQIGWDKLTDSVRENSKQISKDNLLGKGYQIQLMNPDNHQSLYTVKDGQTTFDVANK